MVNVRWLLSGTARVESDHRVEHLDRNPRVGDHGAGKMNLWEVGDADLVGPDKRPQRPPPPAHEIERSGQPERRKQPADRGVLIRDRKRTHSPMVPEERVARDRPERRQRHGGRRSGPHDAPGAVLDVRPGRQEHVVVDGAPCWVLAEQPFQHGPHFVDRQRAAAEQLQGRGEVVQVVDHEVLVRRHLGPAVGQHVLAAAQVDLVDQPVGGLFGVQTEQELPRLMFNLFRQRRGAVCIVGYVLGQQDRGRPISIDSSDFGTSIPGTIASRSWFNRELRKARRLARLAQVLPQIRRCIGRHLGGSEPTRAFTFAAVIELVARSAIRPGSEQYARLRGTRGAATLLKSNVSVYGETVRLSFRAKGGKRVEKEVHAPRLAAAVAVLQKLPGRRLFQYRSEDGTLRQTSAHDVNRFLREIAGAEISLKDFRTLLASVAVLDALARAAPGTLCRYPKLSNGLSQS
jgi:hypothetical protein